MATLALTSKLITLPTPLPQAQAIVVGDIRGKLTLLEGSSSSRNFHGLDVMTRNYSGFTDEIYDLLPNEGDKDPYFPSMRVVDYKVTEGRGLRSVANVVTMGTLRNKLPKPVIKGGWKEATAQLTAIPGGAKTLWQDITSKGNGLGSGSFSSGGSGGGSGGSGFGSLADLDKSANSEVSVTYNSPTTTFLWVTNRKPTRPRYPGYLLAADQSFETIDVRPASFQGSILYGKVIRCITFEVEKVGSYYQVTEENQGLLVSSGIALGIVEGTRFTVTDGVVGSINNFR
jgi:hypothetical protein